MQLSELYEFYKSHPSVTTDTRKLKEGDIFFALSGQNYNGNNYIQQAIEQGAALCVGDDPSLPLHEKILKVPDVLQALQDLAGVHRSEFSIPFIAITGSNGKTTTKELVHAVLSKNYKCYTTAGNLNNHIGVPLTLLSIKMDADIAIVEMGANHQKEIEGYCSYTRPTHGLITNVGKAHLEGFGSEEGIKKGKGELFNYLATHHGTAFINADLPYLTEMAASIPEKIFFGTDTGEYRASPLQGDKMLSFKVTHGADIPLIETNLVGEYNLPNALAAICMGKSFGVEDDDIKSALQEYHPGNSRSQFLQKNSNMIIMDAYNANPGSMKAAIENFGKINEGKKVLYLGAMKELGTQSKNEHQSIVELLEKFKWEEVVLVGEEFSEVFSSFKFFATTEEAKAWYRQQNYDGHSILIKGSRSMAMEKVIEE